MSGIVELRWSISGVLPADYGYRLFGAICHRLPAQVHREERVWTMSPVLGDSQPATDHRLAREDGGGLRFERGELRIRVPLRLLPDFIVLHTPQGLVVGEAGHVVLSPAPTIHPLEPCSTLSSPRVILRSEAGAEPLTRDEFRWQLAERLRRTVGVRARVAPPGATVHVGAASSIRVGTDLSYGYAVEIRDLAARESLLLQEHGLGGRTRMGCGFMLGDRR